MFDIHVIIRRTLTYAGTLSLVAAAYLVFAVAAQAALRDLQGSTKPLWNLVFVASMVLLFDPIRSRVSRIVDWTFFPSRREFRKVIGALAQTLPRLLDSNALVCGILEAVRDSLGARKAFVLLYDRDGESYRLHRLRSDGTPEMSTGRNEPAARWPLDELLKKKVIPLSQADSDDGCDPGRTRFSSRLRAFGIELIVALKRREKILGLVLLGEKNDGSLYSSEDIELLKIMGDQAATAFENALLYDQRKQLARDLHDCAIQSVYGLKLQVELVKLLLGKDPERVIRIVRTMRQRAEEVIRTLRGYANQLSGAGEESGNGFLPRSLQLIREFEEARSVQIGFEIEGEERLKEMPEVSGHLFPILQEAITNAIKHASASKISIRLTADAGAVRLSIENDGRALPRSVWQSLERHRGKHGLKNMRDRARELGGDLEIESEPGKGTVLTWCIPAPTSAEIYE